jgi:glycosyltransferase involved in cell wall biosynthesis
MYKKFVGRKKEEAVYSGFLSENKPRSFTEKLSIWIRGNLFIPDARCFWIEPSIKYLTNEIKKNPVDAIISSGTPHSMHLIALGIKKKLNIPWLADFRDPWTTIDFYSQLMLTRWADAKHHRLEREVLTTADRVTTVSWHWATELSAISNRKVDVITNGYDEPDYAGLVRAPDAKFSVTHIGLLSIERKLAAFWSAVKELINEIPAFKNDLVIRLAGKVDFSVFREIELNGLMTYVENKNYLPHEEALQLQVNASVLILVLNDVPNAKGHIPGKLFEYLAAGRPIICVGPADGDAARILSETKSGKAFDFDDKAGMKKHLQHLYYNYVHERVHDAEITIKSYSRKVLAESVGRLLDELVRETQRV